VCFDKHAVQEHVLFLSTILAIVVEVTHQGKHFSFGQAKYNGDVIARPLSRHSCCHAWFSYRRSN